MNRTLIRFALCALLALAAGPSLYAQLGPLYDMQPNSNSVSTGKSLARTQLGSSLLFTAYDAGGTPHLRKTDGSSVVVFNDAVLAYRPDAVYGKAYFSADNGINGLQPWVTDGTSMSMLTIVPISNGYLSTHGAFAGANNITYLGLDAVQTGGRNIRGRDVYLYRTDGTPTGTVLLKQWTTNELTAGLRQLQPLNSQINVFQIWYGATASKQGVWKTDGTVKGTVVIKSMLISGNESVLYNGAYYFTGNDGTSGMELWKTTGTSAGTTLVSNLNAGSASSSPIYFTLCGNKIYFAATTAANGAELFCHDPSTGATTIVRDIVSGTGSSSPMWLTEMGGKLYFSATTESNGRELYVYDPGSSTSATNPSVIEIWSGAGNGDPKYGYTTGMGDNNNNRFTQFGSYLYFPANDGTGYKLWRSNGTITEEVPGFTTTTATNPNSPTVLGNQLLYVAYTPVEGYQLWTYTPGSVPKLVDGQATPEACSLDQNHPNPFNGTTTLAYALRDAAHVRLTVTDMLGREVAVLVDQQVMEGQHTAVFNAGTLPNGSYLVRLAAGDAVRTRMIKLLR
jgi:ELWxxDGT repeat protein